MVLDLIFYDDKQVYSILWYDIKWGPLHFSIKFLLKKMHLCLYKYDKLIVIFDWI